MHWRRQWLWCNDPYIFHFTATVQWEQLQSTITTITEGNSQPGQDISSAKGTSFSIFVCALPNEASFRLHCCCCCFTLACISFFVHRSALLAVALHPCNAGRPRTHKSLFRSGWAVAEKNTEQMGKVSGVLVYSLILGGSFGLALTI